MLVADGDVHQALKACPVHLDLVLSLWEIPKELRLSLRSKNIMWIDVDMKAQSRDTNDLGDEVSNFLKRFGVRTARYPLCPRAKAASERGAEHTGNALSTSGRSPESGRERITADVRQS